MSFKDFTFNNIVVASSSFVLIAGNITFSLITRNSEIYSLINNSPLRFGIPVGVYFLLLSLITWAIFYTKMSLKYSIYSILILAGIWSNSVEYLIFHNVSDYIPMPLGYANIADFQIWISVITLNVAIWIQHPHQYNLYNSNESDLQGLIDIH